MVVGLSMRSLFFFTTWLLWISFVACHFNETQGKLPINLVHDHIKDYVDYSVDPCHDFYAHACPASTQSHFLQMVDNIKNDLVAEHKKSNPLYRRFNDKLMMDIETTLEKLKNPNPNVNPDPYQQDNLANITLDGFENFTNDQKNKLISRIVDSYNLYTVYKHELNLVSNSYIASQLFDELDNKARYIFKSLKKAVRKSIENTPWAKTNNAIELFQSALDRITFYTFRDARDAVEAWMETYISAFDSCFEMLSTGYENETAEALCEVIAVHKGRQAFLEKKDEKLSVMEDQIIFDSLEMLNFNDTMVYISSAFMLLINSEYRSDVYGSVGFVMLHEIFHSLVFGQDDQLTQNPLLPFWTKNSRCVADQAAKTCTTFNTVKGPNGEEQGCDTLLTFEEDAADMAAYRLVWDLYKNSYSRKVVVPNFESLTKEQLFFYGASTVLCDPNSMITKTNRGENTHSNDYQRVNSLMSQMPAFSKAFKCSPNDKMVQNKGDHCVLYGSHAAVTRKHSKN